VGGHALAPDFWLRHRQQPPPQPSPKGGSITLRRLNRGAMTRHGPRLAGTSCPWPGTRTAFSFSQKITYPRKRRHFAAEIREPAQNLIQGPCCTNSRDFVIAKRPKGVGEGLKPSPTANGRCCPVVQTFISTPRAGTRARPHDVLRTTYRLPRSMLYKKPRFHYR